MIVYSDTISLSTKGFGDTVDITAAVEKIYEKSGFVNGLVMVFCQGATGTITTIEFESGVIQDLKKALEAIAPADVLYEHDRAWGDGNRFSHVRAALMKASLSIPVVQGSMTLGTW